MAASSTVLIEELALGLPDLRQVDGFEIKNGKQISGFLDAVRLRMPSHRS